MECTFFQLAVSDENKIVFFHTYFTKFQGGSSFFKYSWNKDKFPVKVLRLTEFIQRHFKNIQIKLMKLDIAGAEYDVLVDWLYKGLLCEQWISNLYRISS